MAFSDQLRSYLEAEAKSLGGVRRFAEMHGFDRTHLVIFLNGRKLSLDNADRLFDALGLRVDGYLSHPAMPVPLAEDQPQMEPLPPDDGEPFTY